MTNNVHAFLVGVSDYSMINGAKDLPYCKNDLDYFSKALRQGIGINPHNISILGVLKTVTKNAFLNELKKFLSTISNNDTLIFYFSGHGTVLQNNEHYFVLSDGCIPTQIIVNLLDQIPTKNRIVLIDSCMSGHFSLSVPKAMNPISWTDGFVENGCIVLSSCNKTQLSGFHPQVPISLFTSFLCEAFTSRFLTHDGCKSFEDIKEWVLLRAKSWNEQNPHRKQTPIFRSNVGGTIMFKVDDLKPYIPGEYYAEHEDYIIYSIEPMHNGIAKRYSVKVLLKKPTTNDQIAQIMCRIITELESVEIFQSQRCETMWQGKKPNIVFSYFGYDESDIVNANYAYRAIWADDNQDKGWWYKTIKDSRVIDDIYVVSTSYYDIMHKFNAENTEDASNLIEHTKKIISGMINYAEQVIHQFNEYQNENINEAEFISYCTPLFKEISRLYFAETELGIPPVTIHEWSQRCSNIAATIHDFTLYYGDKCLTDRTADNRLQCMKRAIRRYQDDLRALDYDNKLC